MRKNMALSRQKVRRTSSCWMVLGALRAELEGRREEFQEDASDEVDETEAETEAEMLSVLQNNWAIKQQKKRGLLRPAVCISGAER